MNLGKGQGHYAVHNLVHNFRGIARIMHPHSIVLCPKHFIMRYAPTMRKAHSSMLCYAEIAQFYAMRPPLYYNNLNHSNIHQTESDQIRLNCTRVNKNRLDMIRQVTRGQSVTSQTKFSNCRQQLIALLNLCL